MVLDGLGRVWKVWEGVGCGRVGAKTASLALLHHIILIHCFSMFFDVFCWLWMVLDGFGWVWICLEGFGRALVTFSWDPFEPLSLFPLFFLYFFRFSA